MKETQYRHICYEYDITHEIIKAVIPENYLEIKNVFIYIDRLFCVLKIDTDSLTLRNILMKLLILT